MDDIIRQAASVTPTPRQIALNRMEFYGFVHFGLYTFAPHERGQTGPEVFNPVHFDARQWARAFRQAGMTGLLLTCKHHEGFCLWPSAYTDFSVKSSPWRDGKGDVVREVADACQEEGLRFGVYLSPWDMHEKTYGTDAYNDYFKNQLRELLQNYGDVFCVWFDGACREKNFRQEYDWDGYYRLIRELQPNACISICGPDVRWCGNEAGQCRDAEWSVVPRSIMTTERDPGYWRKLDEVPNATWQDLGSREFLRKHGEGGLMWFPAEVDVSIRPSWGYMPGEEHAQHSLATLMTMYERAVGGNATLLLNVPPNPDGIFDQPDIDRLAELGGEIRRVFSKSQFVSAEAVSPDSAEGHAAVNALSSCRECWWQSCEDAAQPTLEVRFPEVRQVNLTILQEAIETGQHVESFRLEGLADGKWVLLYEGTTIGYKRICRFPTAAVEGLRYQTTEARGFTALTFFCAYYDCQAD